MAIYYNSDLPYYVKCKNELVDKIYWNGVLVFPHFLYRLMPNFQTAPNSIPPHKIRTGIGITRVEAIDPANGFKYWSGEYLEHGSLMQAFDVKTMYNYYPPSPWDTVVTWSPNGNTTINNSKSNRKKCKLCTIERSVIGYFPAETHISVYNPNDTTVEVTYSVGSTKFTKTISANGSYKEVLTGRFTSASCEDTWDPLGGYIPANGSESPNYAPNLDSDGSGKVTVTNNNSYAYTHYLVYSPDDPTLRNATKIWSGTLQGSSSYPGNHHTLTNQRSGYYGAFCGDPKYSTTPWVGMYLLN